MWCRYKYTEHRLYIPFKCSVATTKLGFPEYTHRLHIPFKYGVDTTMQPKCIEILMLYIPFKYGVDTTGARLGMRGCIYPSNMV